MIMTTRNGRLCPCKGCPDRYPGCSDHCRKDAYLRWKQEQDLIRANRAKGRDNDSYTVDAIRKNRRRCR